MDRQQAAEELVRLEKYFSAKQHPSAAFKAVFICFVHDIPVPAWAKRSFVYLLGLSLKGEFRSWDHVLGRPPTKAEVRRWQRHADAIPEVSRLIREASKAGEPINDALFESIGRKLGIGGKTTVKKIYGYRQRRDPD
jgi:hypothetical protein